MKNYVFFGISVLCAMGMTEANQKIKLGDLPEQTQKREGEPSDPHHKVNKPIETSQKKESSPIEENYQLIKDVSEEFYQKGLKALDQGDLPLAEDYFDRTLTIKPNHPGAKAGLEAIMKAYEETTPRRKTVDPKEALLKRLEDSLYEQLSKEDYDEAANVAKEILAIEPKHQIAKQKLNMAHKKLSSQALERATQREQSGDEQGAIDAYQLALVYGKDNSLKEKITALRHQLVEKNKKLSSEIYVQALAASQQSKVSDAMALCKKALLLDPTNFQAQRMLERLSAELTTPAAP